MGQATFPDAATTATTEETARVADPTTGALNEAKAGKVTIYLERKKVEVPLVPGETLLETARRAGLDPPFNCEAGNCGTCMAHLEEGHANMRINDALDDDEVADGYILTCQGVPDTGSITVRYE
ncbi:2Fe-2S iron-sulfur cluster-binding protein [Mycobacterium shigaense]|uniref:2Fe-2S iron-sulfur cluster-binding protein n=1 Tax=Mycobacterium shigaense TaxID=722731 RepID=UPI000BBB351E|nr:2Fe-2S iron-sulfur cluster binding domain-containing protein [Mycobacterium shigaense]MEA1120482.1 2Fe-2S iron-sulfur cluster binding domain-containing protein [Mycobacterium shigaense]